MPMFGAAARTRDQALANPQPYQPMFAPENLMPDPGPLVANATPMPQMTAPQVKGGGIFGNSDPMAPLSPGRAALAAFLGGLGGNNPVPQMLQQRQQLLIQDRARAQALDDARQTWLMQQQYKAAHPDPNAVPDVVQLARIANDPTQPDYVRKAASDRMAAQNDPIITANLPGGSFYNGPRSGLVSIMQGGGDPASGGAGGGAPRDIPLVSSPDEARRLPPGSQFRTPDGRVLRVPGGPTQPASGGFR